MKKKLYKKILFITLAATVFFLPNANSMKGRSWTYEDVEKKLFYNRPKLDNETNIRLGVELYNTVEDMYRRSGIDYDFNSVFTHMNKLIDQRKSDVKMTNDLFLELLRIRKKSKYEMMFEILEAMDDDSSCDDDDNWSDSED